MIQSHQTSKIRQKVVKTKTPTRFYRVSVFCDFRKAFNKDAV